MKEETEAIRFAETTRLGSYIYRLGLVTKGGSEGKLDGRESDGLVWLNTIIKIKALISKEGVNANLRDYREVIVVFGLCIFFFFLLNQIVGEGYEEKTEKER